MSATGRPRLVKLVRDRIGALLGSSEVVYRPIDDKEQAIEALRFKLIEEAIEYVRDPSVGELADVQAVVDALATLDPALGDGKALGGARGQLAIKREKEFKRAARGGFDGLTGMYVFTTADSRHEGDKS